MSSRILVLDDRWQQEHWKESFDDWLPDSVDAVYEEFGFKALERLREYPEIKLIFLDLQFENQPEQGEEILDKIKANYPDLRVVILTSVNDSQLALRLVHDQKKAYYYFFKDALDPDQVRKLIENAIESYDFQAESVRKTDIGMIVGESPALTEVLRLAERASLVDSSVLLSGESGTGKELLARAIHLNSRRNHKPFIAVNCGAIPEELIESEFFGHVKGAFTNALSDRRGRFEMADGGTLFLDEVPEMTPALQVKLLRALEVGEFERVGSERTQKANVRIVAATNRRLENLVKEGRFRDDLYYRLNVLSIRVPPLRDRLPDIIPLVNYFMERLNNRLGESKEVSSSALELFARHAWPGNIRELEHALERAMVNSTADVLTDDDFKFLIVSEGNSNAANQLISQWVDDAASGRANWDDIRREFGAAGDGRRKIMEGVIATLRQRLGSRPSGADLANVLEIKRNYLNQILKELDLQLRDF